ncbi:hypothetical protein HFO33_12845 [Rhizobium leguminosarum]|nr:hypothetical protein [Rhizobium leguminosarum]MBY5717455.1 hypothetical protein [Rhizobium leguminosarum]
MAQDLAAGIHEHHALRDLAGKAHSWVTIVMPSSATATDIGSNAEVGSS